MSIIVNIQLTGESGAEITNDLRVFLNGMTAYKGEPLNGSTAISAGTVTTEEPPRMTAAQKKAAEKAAKDAAEAAAKAAQQAISAGEERVDPEADKQDAADEAADTKAAAPEPAKLTHDDVKKVLGTHVQAFGMAASQADVKVLLNGAEKLSAIPDTQKDLAAAILTIANAIEKNPRKHEIDGDGLDAAAIAKITPIVVAARAVK